MQNVQASFQKATRIGQSSEFQFQQKSGSVKLQTLKGMVGWEVTTDPRYQKVCLCVATFIRLKPTIHEATFVAGDTATLLFVHAAHEISNATFYKLLENSK